MPRKPAKTFDEKQLTKGQLRKLNALRKSLGDQIAVKAFSEWYKNQAAEEGVQADKNLTLIADALQPLIDQKKLRMPRSGYIVKRGRGRVIVEPAAS